MKYWLLILYGVLIACVIIAVAYLLKVEPIYSFLGNLSFPSLNIDLSSLDVGKLVTENLGTVIGIVGTGVTALIAYAKYRSVNNTNKLLEEQQQILTHDKENLTATVTGQAQQLMEKQQELEMYAGDSTAQTLQGRIEEMKGYVHDREIEFKTREESLVKQIEDLSKRLEREIAERPVTVKTEIR